MGKKKAFVDKSKSVTFRLIPAVDTAPKPVGNPELVNVVPITDEELAEREKYGIYYADNYNYMSHLKARDELPAFHLSEKATLAPKSVLKLATHIIEVKGKEIPLDAIKNAAIPSVSAVDIEDEIDPDILEMLNEGEDGFGDEGELDDNFLNMAGGVDMPEGRRIYEEFRKTAAQLSDSEDDEEMPDMEDIMEDEEMNEEEFVDNKPRSILKSTPILDKSELDARFNQFYENMAGSDFEDDDAEYSEDEPEIDEALLENFADEYQEEKEKGHTEKPDPLSKALTLKAYKKQELERNEETEQIEVDVRSKKAKWDCESVTSTYSNIYNHPTLIREESKRKNKLKKVLDTDVDEKMECETESIRSTRSVASTVRLRGETSEDRRERKKAVKEERRERRVEKKTLKGMFKDEKKLADAQRGHVFVSGRPIA